MIGNKMNRFIATFLTFHPADFYRCTVASARPDPHCPVIVLLSKLHKLFVDHDTPIWVATLSWRRVRGR
jgi:hypothetical protein